MSVDTVDRGRGSPLVLIPGLQGRWQWTIPTIDALAERHRVLSFELGPHPFDLDVLDAVLDEAGAASAALIGVSFGGLVAVRYAAQRPERVSALVLVSAPAPRMRLNRSSQMFLKYPRLAVPAFAVRGVARLAPEIIAAPMSWPKRTTFAVEHIGRTLRWPILPTQMAESVAAWRTIEAELIEDCRRVTAPTLVVTGEPKLDRVVPVESSVEYLTLIRGSRHVVLDRTGHLGLVSRPYDFVALVTAFVDAGHKQSAEAAACR